MRRRGFRITREYQVVSADEVVLGHVEKSAAGWVKLLPSGDTLGRPARTATLAGQALLRAATTEVAPARVERAKQAARDREALGAPSPQYEARTARIHVINLCAERYIRDGLRGSPVTRRQAYAMCGSMYKAGRLTADGEYAPKTKKR